MRHVRTISTPLPQEAQAGVIVLLLQFLLNPLAFILSLFKAP